MERLRLGATGEALVAKHYVSTGCRIIERNWRCPFGELDLIALDGDEVVFVEVKTRRSDAFGQPEDAVTWEKRGKLRRCANAYLGTRGWSGRRFRVDIVAVLLPHAGRPSMTRFRGCVSENG